MSRPNLSAVTEWESRGRTAHSHWDGVEVQRIFHMRPYSQAHQVAAALEGSVYYEADGGGSRWVRALPARDPYCPECYCNEVRIDHVDPQKDSISFSPSIRWSRFIVKKSPEAQVAHFLERTRLVGEEPAGGAFLTASYRPLVSAYRPFVSPGDEEEGPSEYELAKQFDWIEPRFMPGNLTVPWPEGLNCNSSRTIQQPFIAQVPPETAKPIHLPVHEFTIRRLLVGSIPWQTINWLTNTVNAGVKTYESVGEALSGWGWPYREDQNRTDLPRFLPGTLRFDKCEVVDHYSRTAANNKWFELIYHFSWLCFQDHNVYDRNGYLLNGGNLTDVTWNHVLMSPSHFLKHSPFGWYFVFKSKVVNWRVAWSPFVTKIIRGQGPLYAPGDFDALFDLQST